MKFSLKQIRYTLYMNAVSLLSDIRMIPFTVKLKVLCWWYGGGANIPPGKLGNVLVGGEEAAADMLFAANVHRASVEVADKLRLPEDRRKFTILVAHYFGGKIEDVDVNETVKAILAAPKPRMAMYNAMRACGDVVQDDITHFQEDWPSFVAWLKEPINFKE